jgi:site-specific DNA-adenine methylase
MSLLTYPGSKRRYINELETYIPAGTKTVLAPFFGGGSFEFHLAHKGYRVIACDVFPELINFWKQVRLHPNEVANEVESVLPLTKSVGMQIVKLLRDGKITNKITQAASFFIMNKCSFNGITNGIYLKSMNKFNVNYRKQLAKMRHFVWPPTLSLYQCNYSTLLSKYPTEFVYADPPYKLEHNNLYGIRAGQYHKDFDHEHFYNIMKKRKHWIITYNAHPIILEMYRKYTIKYIQDTTTTFATRKHQHTQGHIIISNI